MILGNYWKMSGDAFSTAPATASFIPITSAALGHGDRQLAFLLSGIFERVAMVVVACLEPGLIGRLRRLWLYRGVARS